MRLKNNVVKFTIRVVKNTKLSFPSYLGQHRFMHIFIKSHIYQYFKGLARLL